MTQTLRDFLSEECEGVLCFSEARMALFDIEAGFWGLRRQIEALVGPRMADAVLQQAGANGGASFARSFMNQTPAVDGPQALRDCIAAYQVAGFGKFAVDELAWPLGRVVVRAQNTFEAWAVRQNGPALNQPVLDRPACAYTAGVLVGFVNVIADRNDVVCVQHSCEARGDDECRFELLPADVAGDVPIVSLAPDPALGRQLNLLELLFDHMPMGIVILDRDLRVRRFNPTWAEFIDRYALSPSGSVVPGAYYFDLDPGTEEHVMPVFERVLAGETLHLEAFPLPAKGETSYWDAVLSPLVEDGEVVGIIDVTTDATERQRAKEALEESQRMLATLISNLPGMVYRCRNDPHWTMTFVSEGSLELTGYRPDELMGNHAVSYGDLIYPDDRAMVWESVQAALATGDPYQVTYRIVTPDGEKWVWEQGRGVISDAGEVLAIEGFITDVSERVMNEQALERRVKARTEEIEQRRRVAEGLRGILEVLNSTRSLDEILDYIVRQATELLGAQAGLLFRLEPHHQYAFFEASFGLPFELVEMEYSTVDNSSGNQDLLNRRPVGVVDFPAYVAQALHDPDAGLTEKDAWWYRELADRYQSILGAPLIVRDEVYGGLIFYYCDRHPFVNDEQGLAASLANQTALAIENARLRVQAEQAAVMQERQRLARELHDSVSQALYGIGLGARTARKLLEQGAVDPDVRTSLDAPLDYVLSLADAGLTEMRALIFELHPDALEKEGLVAALQRQAKTVRARHKLAVEVDLCEEPDVGLDVKEALYRIAQEAMNNIVKHARAGRIDLQLRCRDGTLLLDVADDGIGFDPDRAYPGHLGLRSMRERVVQLGGELSIESAPGEGAVVRVRVSLRPLGSGEP
jgi:PAS domain S-box-containing protein